MRRLHHALPAVLLTAAGLSPQARPQEPKIPEKALALDATFKSLQEALGAIGRVENVWHYRDDKTGARWTVKLGMEYSNLRASAPACRVDYDWRRIVNGQPDAKQRNTILLSGGWHVSVKPGAQVAKEDDARAGHPEWTAQIDPPRFVVTIQGPGRQQIFPFTEQGTAGHAAEVLSGAMRLCGGGDPPEPGLGQIKPPGEELRESMKYIEDQAGHYGPVNYLVQERHSKQLHLVNYATEVTRFRADPQACRISFHERVSVSGQKTIEVDRGAALRDVRQVTVNDQTHRLKQTTHDLQHVDADFKVEPEVYVIDIFTRNDLVPVSTYDGELALRLARVFARAAELCGGGPGAY